jgi:hypothetical protein
MLKRWWRALLLGLAIAASLHGVAPAQHNHAAGHDVYQDWRNARGDLCCRNGDCGSLEPAEVRSNSGQLEVQVEGVWCPVAPWMTVGKRYSSPNWSRAHACVWPNGGEIPQPTCQRLKCFKGEGGF